MKENRAKTVLENHVVAIVLALTFLVPLLFAGPSAQRLDQLTAYGLLGVLLLVVWLARAQGMVTWERVRSVATRGPNPAIGLFVLWSAVTTFLSPHRFYGELALVQLFFGVLVYAMVAYQFSHKEQSRALLTCLQVVGVLLVVGALALDGERQLLDLAGSFHDRQLFGAFLGLILPVLIGAATGTRDRRWKMAGQLAAILVAAALLLTRCRSSWLGVTVALVLFLLLSLRYAWNWKLVEQRKHDLLIAPVLGLVVVAITISLAGMRGPLHQRVATFASLSDDNSVVGRFQSWEIALKVAASRPVTGTGPGGYALAQVPFNPESRTPEQILRTGPSLSEDPHNRYLQIAAEQGVPGLLLHLAILGLWFAFAVRGLRGTQRGLRQSVLIGCIAAVAGHCLDSVSNPAWTFPEVSTFLWMVLGLGMQAAGVNDQAPAPGDVAEVPPTGLPQLLYGRARPVLIGGLAVSSTMAMFNLSLASPAMGNGIPGGVRTAQLPAYEQPREGGGAGIITQAGVAAVIGAVSNFVGSASAIFSGGIGVPVGPGSQDDQQSAMDGNGPGIGGSPGAFMACAEHCCEERLPTLPADHREITDLRVSPLQSTLWADYSRCFHLEAKSKKNDKWYSVTHRPETRFAIDGPANSLVRTDERKNVYGVPWDAPKELDRKSSFVVGTFAPPEGEPREARGEVIIRIPTERLGSLPEGDDRITDIRLVPQYAGLNDDPEHDTELHPDYDGEKRPEAASMGRDPLASTLHTDANEERKPWRTILRRGCCRAFYLEVRSARDNRWYSVTHNRQARLYLREPEECVERKEGTRNVFCVSHAASSQCDRKVAVLYGVFEPRNGPPMRAEAHIEVRTSDERLRPLPEDHSGVSEVRIVPDKTIIHPGCCRSFHLEAKSRTNDKWYSVTDRESATFEITSFTECLVKKKGTKNQFCLKPEAPASCHNQIAIITGRFTAPDGETFAVESKVRVWLPGVDESNQGMRAQEPVSGGMGGH